MCGGGQLVARARHARNKEILVWSARVLSTRLSCNCALCGVHIICVLAPRARDLVPPRYHTLRTVNVKGKTHSSPLSLSHDILLLSPSKCFFPIFYFVLSFRTSRVINIFLYYIFSPIYTS